MDVVVAEVESVDLALVFRVNIVSLVKPVFLSVVVVSLVCPNTFDEVVVRGKIVSV